MTTNDLVKSDLSRVFNIVQNSMIVYPKEAIIATLKDFFSRDTYYRYVADSFGFNKTPDQTNLAIDAGLNDNSTTRVGIFEANRFDVIFYPCLIVKHGGSRSVPISMSMDDSSVQWEIYPFDDGYGNLTFVKRPKSFIFAGAWEGTITIDVMSRSLRARDDLIQYTALCLTNIYFKELVKAGVIIKPISVSGPSEIEDRNDKLFKQTITCEIRTEWRREIPITNIVDIINFSIDFANLAAKNPIVAKNLSIYTTDNIINSFLTL